MKDNEHKIFKPFYKFFWEKVVFIAAETNKTAKNKRKSVLGSGRCTDSI